MKFESSRLIIPNKIKYLEPLMHYATKIAEGTGFKKEEIQNIQVALEEAITFAIYNFFEEDEENTLELIFQHIPSGMRFILKDKGLPLDPDRLPKYSPGEEDADLSGLGIFLITKLMDRVAFVNLGREGKEWHMIKNIKSKRIESCYPELKKSNQQEETQPSDSVKRDFKFTIMDFQDEYGIEISKCAYRSYGYSYEEYIYYPEKIIELNKDGMLHSIVAVTDAGDLMGHIALKFDIKNNDIAEMGVAFVNPEYRSSGIFTKLFVSIIEKGIELGLRGLSGRAVTGHEASQKVCLKYGLETCGILLGAFPKDVEFKKITGVIPQRESGVLMFKGLRKREETVLYPPPKHHQIIKDIYKNLGIDVIIGEPPSDLSHLDDQEIHITTSKQDILNTVEIKIYKYGKNVLKNVVLEMHYHKLEKTDVMFLYLDLEDPYTYTFAEECEKMGFFFSGVLPGALLKNDALILQFLNNQKIDYNLLHPFAPFSKVLLDYVSRQDPMQIDNIMYSVESQN